MTGANLSNRLINSMDVVAHFRSRSRGRCSKKTPQNEEKEVTPKEKREGPEMIGEVSLEGGIQVFEAEAGRGWLELAGPTRGWLWLAMACHG